MSVRIKNEKIEYLKVYDNGLSEANLEFAKKSLLFDTIRNCTDFIKVTKEYPEDGKQKINLSLDVIVMSVVEYDELIAKNKHLKFDKL